MHPTIRPTAHGWDELLADVMGHGARAPLFRALEQPLGHGVRDHLDRVWDAVQVLPSQTGWAPPRHRSGSDARCAVDPA